VVVICALDEEEEEEEEEEDEEEEEVACPHASLSATRPECSANRIGLAPGRSAYVLPPFTTKIAFDPFGHGWRTVSDDPTHAATFELVMADCFDMAALQRPVSVNFDVDVPDATAPVPKTAKPKVKPATIRTDLNAF
jgi:hypothetical protein